MPLALLLLLACRPALSSVPEATRIDTELGCDALPRVAADVRRALDAGQRIEQDDQVLAWLATCAAIPAEAGASAGLLHQPDEQDKAHRAVTTIGAHLRRLRAATGPVTVSDSELAALEASHQALIAVDLWVAPRHFTAEELSWFRAARNNSERRQERPELYARMNVWTNASFLEP